jgi:hypothetical protein
MRPGKCHPNPLTRHRSIDPRALLVRNIPVRSPSVVIADQAQSYGHGSYQADAYDPVAGGRDSTTVAMFTIDGGRRSWRASRNSTSAVEAV